MRTGTGLIDKAVRAAIKRGWASPPAATHTFVVAQYEGDGTPNPKVALYVDGVKVAAGVVGAGAWVRKVPSW